MNNISRHGIPVSYWVRIIDIELTKTLQKCSVVRTRPQVDQYQAEEMRREVHTRREGFQAMSEGSLQAMPKHSDRLNY